MHGHTYRKLHIVTSVEAAIAGDRGPVVLSRRREPGPGTGGGAGP